MGRVCIPSRGPEDWRARLADPDRLWLAAFAAFATRFGLTVGASEAAERALPFGTVLRLGWACGEARFTTPVEDEA